MPAGPDVSSLLCFVYAPQPAPAGRWLFVGVGARAELSPGFVDADYPFACSAGLLGGTLLQHQVGPQCRGPCPAGALLSRALYSMLLNAVLS